MSVLVHAQAVVSTDSFYINIHIIANMVSDVVSAVERFKPSGRSEPPGNTL
jgi:hypothetical protein